MAEQTLYEVWLPGQEQPSHILADGDKAARIARDEGGVFVKQGTSDDDRQALFDVKFPKALPDTRVPAGLEVAIGIARSNAARDALEDHLRDSAYDNARDEVPASVKAAFAAQSEALDEVDKASHLHDEAVRISMEEPERDAGGETSPLPKDSTIDGGVVRSVEVATAAGAVESAVDAAEVADDDEDDAKDAKSTKPEGSSKASKASK
jgi:hypothetical protein